MTTKRELREAIESLSQKLGASINTERMNVAQLTTLLEDLQTRGAAAVPAPENAPADGSEPAKPEADPPEGNAPPLPFAGVVRSEPDLGVVPRSEPTSTSEPPVPPETSSISPAPEVVETSVGSATKPPEAHASVVDVSGPPAAAAPATYFVANGKVVKTLIGDLGATMQVKERHVSGGRETLEKLWRDGFLIKKP